MHVGIVRVAGAAKVAQARLNQPVPVRRMHPFTRDGVRWSACLADLPVPHKSGPWFCDHARMVAVIRCASDEQEHIEFYERLYGENFPEWSWFTNRRRIEWKKANLVLILTGSNRGNPAVSRLGWARVVKRVDDLNTKIEITRIYRVEPSLPWGQLIEAMAAEYRARVRPEGWQSDKTGKNLVAAMLRLRPNWRDLASAIEGIRRTHYLGDSNSAQTLALQRDASIGISRMAGMDITSFSEWSPPTDPLADSSIPPNFIDGLPGTSAHEDQLINRDMENMLGVMSQATRHVNWRIFSQRRQKLLVVNANREPAERILGVDMIYYNITRQSLVLVQYKKLNSAKNGSYYPSKDGNLDRELERMREVDKRTEGGHREEGEFRLYSKPSWIKICYPNPNVPSSCDMAHGMYLAREHFEQLRVDERLKGSGGGVSFGYKNVPSYLDNTMFIRLTETGLIGTSGASTDFLHEVIWRSFDEGKSLAVGMLDGDDLPQSERNSLRRNSK
ncbi:hypothetical protein [Saccharopolyspora erythraea]|nr:hypothetical protein [Saccharopolyspora erythraea]QRK90819.1 hypothetical protein JQX30_04920 [Saccharopolyspora erythraea]